MKTSVKSYEFPSPELSVRLRVEVASNAKVLGLPISQDLEWNNHIAEIVKKVSKRLYFLRQLKRAKIHPKDLLTFYLTCVRPVMEYACLVFMRRLASNLSKRRS